MTTAYACGSGGVMFVPDRIEKTMPLVRIRRSNDNQCAEEKRDGDDKKLS